MYTHARDRLKPNATAQSDSSALSTPWPFHFSPDCCLAVPTPSLKVVRYHHTAMASRVGVYQRRCSFMYEKSRTRYWSSIPLRRRKTSSVLVLVAYFFYMPSLSRGKETTRKQKPHASHASVLSVILHYTGVANVVCSPGDSLLYCCGLYNTNNEQKQTGLVDLPRGFETLPRTHLDDFRVAKLFQASHRKPHSRR